MDMVAILAVWSQPLEGTFVPPTLLTHEGSTWNVALIGPLHGFGGEDVCKCWWWLRHGYNEPSAKVS